MAARGAEVEYRGTSLGTNPRILLSLPNQEGSVDPFSGFCATNTIVTVTPRFEKHYIAVPCSDYRMFSSDIWFRDVYVGCVVGSSFGSQEYEIKSCREIVFSPEYTQFSWRWDEPNERVVLSLESSLRQQSQLICFTSETDDDARTGTEPGEEHEHLDERGISNVVVSEQVAARLRAKEVSAFVPVSAADLIWLEALSMDEDPNE